MTLATDYSYCESVIKKHSKSFYYAFSNLNEKDRNAVYAVYAFCRMADDAVDNAKTKSEKSEQLKKVQNELDQFKNNIWVDSPVWRALKDVKENYNLPIEMMEKQLDGQRMDIEYKQPNDLTDLENYSAYVAGSVGVLLLPILCDKNNESRINGAESLGVAMQYTNILRDIGEDIKKLDRIYLPKTLMAKYDVTQMDLFSEKISENFIKLWECIASYAEEKYDAFMNEVIYYKSEAQLGLMLSALIYKEILNEVRQNGYDCLSKRQSVSFVRKTQIKLEATKQLKLMREGHFNEK